MIVQTHHAIRRDIFSSSFAERTWQRPFGGLRDYDYREEKDFGTCTLGNAVCAEHERDAWTSALDGLSTVKGGDFAESQSIALMSAIEQWHWTSGYTKVCQAIRDGNIYCVRGSCVFCWADQPLLGLCRSRFGELHPILGKTIICSDGVVPPTSSSYYFQQHYIFVCL